MDWRGRHRADGRVWNHHDIHHLWPLVVRFSSTVILFAVHCTCGGAPASPTTQAQSAKPARSSSAAPAAAPATSPTHRVTRAGPVFYGATTAPGYSLFSVTVLSDDEAVAVGGSPTTPEGAGSSGVIVRTVNGGLSWAMCQYPGAGMPNVPALMGVAAQPKSDNVWAGGFVTAANTQATLAAGAEYCERSGSFPSCLSVPHLVFSRLWHPVEELAAEHIGTDLMLPGARRPRQLCRRELGFAQGRRRHLHCASLEGPRVRNFHPRMCVGRSRETAHCRQTDDSLQFSDSTCAPNLSATFQAAIPSSFPSGFVQYSTNGVAPTILNNVFGIVWRVPILVRASNNVSSLSSVDLSGL